MRVVRLVSGFLLAIAGISLTLALLPQPGAGAASAGVLVRGPFLARQMTDSVQIIWRTATLTDSIVRYGIDLPYAQQVTSSELTTTHVVTLEGLQPGTLYWYGIFAGDESAPLAAATFRTNRSEAQPYFSFAALGDSGVASAEQYAAAGLLERLQPAFVIHTGDVIYPAGEPGGFDPRFFMPYSRTLRSAPFYTSMGNHDHLTADGAPYLENFYLPSNNPAGVENYYSFNYANAHFVALDTAYGVAGSAMIAWLRADLAATNRFWKIVYFHHAIYTSAAHANDAYVVPLRAVLAPIFEEYNVDLVFMGHDHAYERSKTMREFVPSSRGVSYIVTGGGGAPLYARAITNGYWTAAFFSTPDYWHAVNVTINSCRLSLQAIRALDDVTFDALALDRCNRAYVPLFWGGGSPY